jgi:hypothetical protein
VGYLIDVGDCKLEVLVFVLSFVDKALDIELAAHGMQIFGHSLG